MKQKAINTSPQFYHTYIEKVNDLPLLEVLKHGGVDLFVSHLETLESIGNKIYAPNKWTIKEIIQHVIDTERIFINRALRFVRMDNTNLPGYDHDAYVPVSRANDQSLINLIEEYKVLRQSSCHFFNKLNVEELLRKGTANGNEMSVLAIGFILVGHPIHHFKVMEERYFNLI